MLSIIIAFVLSLIAPGMGQVFNGQYLFGFCLALFFVFARPVVLPLLIRIINFKTEVKLLKFIYCFNILFTVFIVITALDACLVAARAQYLSFLRALYCFITALLLTGAARQLRSEFIIFALSKRSGLSRYIFTKKN